MGSDMHNAAYRAALLPWHYVPFRVEDLEGAIVGMRALGIRGFGVSYPYKEAIIPFLDGVDPWAERMGAVNTVVNDGGRLTGHNTDWVGATRALQEHTVLDGRRVLLLGAGGAARACAFGFVEAGASVTVYNRSAEKARALAAVLPVTVVDTDIVPAAREFDIVVNATSLGMSDVDAKSPLPEGALRAGQLVMDIVYKPLETAFVALARKAGCVTVTGDRMLLFQAAKQFELYTGMPAPHAAMEAALARHLSHDA